MRYRTILQLKYVYQYLMQYLCRLTARTYSSRFRSKAAAGSFALRTCIMDNNITVTET